MSDAPINDTGETDAVGDEDIDWTNVDVLAARYAEIEAIADPDERLAAARALVAEMAGDS